MYQSDQVWAKFWAKSHYFSKIFCKFKLILVQLWENFEKSTHSYTKFCKGSFVYQEADFATHVGGTSP